MSGIYNYYHYFHLYVLIFTVLIVYNNEYNLVSFLTQFIC